MTREQYDEMMEFAKEEIDSVMDYLEVNYDDLSIEDFLMLYQAIFGESMEEAEKDKAHRVLLEAMYELSEKHPKELMRGLNKVKN